MKRNGTILGMNEAFCLRPFASLHKLSKNPISPLTCREQPHGAERTSELMALAQHERAPRHCVHSRYQIIKCFLILQEQPGGSETGFVQTRGGGRLA